MKKLYLSFTLVFVFAVLHGQNQLTNTGNLQIHAGATVTFFGDFANNGTLTDGGTAVSFNGTATQIISGASTTSFNNLILNNGTGFTLQRSISIINSMALTAGQLNLNLNTLTVINPAGTAVSRTLGHILSEQTNNSNKVIWSIGTNTSAHVFPFATAAGVYIPFSLTVTAGTIGNVTVSTYPTASNNTPYPTSPVLVTDVNRFGLDNSANVVDRFWQIDKDGPTGTATLNFTATPAEIGTITTLLAQRWNALTSKWEDPIAGQSSGATTATVAGVTAFSPWTLAGNNAPLPIELLSFTATVVKGHVDVNWETTSEVNNDYFTVQRSEDGIAFEEMVKIPANPSVEITHKYNYLDRNPFSGKSYYRLKQTDFDGVYSYSKPRMVEITESAAGMTAFPNPAIDHQFSLDFHNSLETPTAVVVYDVMGKIVFSGVVNQGIRIFPIELNSNLTTGEYIVKAENGDFSVQERIILE
ncbi:MAG: T9SS type A sorting domain-containing protein [Chryseolinea sp.]